MKLPITVVIPVRNEERNLPACLASLNDSFAKVLVVDSGSTDATKSISENAGAQVLDFRWDGKFPKKRNWVLRNHAFETPWVFFLDADERVTPDFIDELHRLLPKTTDIGFWIAFRNWFMGRPLGHGDTMRKLALFRVGAGEYEKFAEDYWSNLDMEVHEHPVLIGAVGQVASKLDHYDYRGFHHYVAKHNEYSTWEANRYDWLKQNSHEHWEQLTQRQKFKYRNLDKWWLGLVYFMASYFLKLGFLDGRVGWTFNRLKMRYFNDIRLKIRELRTARRP
jgi:glycosyltransferase involved in cell wall biosynthesis